MHQVEAHGLPVADVARQLASDPATGLTAREAAHRLARYGPNELPHARPRNLLSVFLGQFQDFMVLVLLGATGISFFLGEVGDAVTILLIVVVNAVLGALQEFRAERSLEALKEMSAPTARVRRDGEEHRIPAAEVVPGDLLLLEAGDKPAADARLLQVTELAVEESLLTGESVPVLKSADWLGDARAPIGERRNMVFAGTTVVRGRGLGLVTATASATAMGGIAQLLSEQKTEPTPLQQRLEGLGRVLVWSCLAIAAVVVVAGVLRGESLLRMFLAGVSLAVAAIPEGLPAIVTIALAVGVQRMLRRNALVRHLPAVETLGSATVVCSDKTGTLTRNEMTVRRLITADGEYRLTGDGYDLTGRVVRTAGERHGDDARPVLEALALCQNAELHLDHHRARPEGDPLEVALIVAARKADIDVSRLLRERPRLLEVPFSSEAQRMTVVVRSGAGLLQVTKGAPEAVLRMCATERVGGRAITLTPERRSEWLARTAGLGEESLRTLAVAAREVARPSEQQGLTFLGMVGLYDPPRAEVREAVRTCRRAGIRTVMVTGDHPATAEAIARELGILRAGEHVARGVDVEQLSDLDLRRLAQTTTVYARVSPQFKLRLVEALSANGEIVAMTGDGLNDAPALRAADIGVAMGVAGCDVTKEAADMVLADDNFATIVAAVEEGRGIYDNVRKFVRYLLACNVGEVLVMFGAAISGLALPLLPIQILWVNLATDGLPALALGLEPVEPDVLHRPPRPPEEGVFARRLGWRIISRGTLIGFSTLGMFVVALAAGTGLPLARTLTFATLVMSQLFHSFDCRSETRSIVEMGLTSNPYLLAAVLTSIGLLLAAIYPPWAAQTFRTVPLDLANWLAVVAVSGLGSFGIAVRRRLLRRRRARSTWEAAVWKSRS